MTTYTKNEKGRLQRVYSRKDVTPKAIAEQLEWALNYVPQPNTRGDCLIARGVAAELGELADVTVRKTRDLPLALNVARASLLVAHTPKGQWQNNMDRYNRLYDRLTVKSPDMAVALLATHRDGGVECGGSRIVFHGAVDDGKLNRKFKKHAAPHYLAEVRPIRGSINPRPVAETNGPDVLAVA
jgi:hypothetical protein